MNKFTHWVPEPIEETGTTACGLNIDYPEALAWTRSEDLEAYSNDPFDNWPPPCPKCKEIIVNR